MIIEIKLCRPSQKMVEELTGIEPQHQVLVLSDVGTLDIARSLTSAARAITDTVDFLIKPMASEHSNRPRWCWRPPTSPSSPRAMRSPTLRRLRLPLGRGPELSRSGTSRSA